MTCPEQSEGVRVGVKVGVLVAVGVIGPVAVGVGVVLTVVVGATVGITVGVGVMVATGVRESHLYSEPTLIAQGAGGVILTIGFDHQRVHTGVRFPGLLGAGVAIGANIADQRCTVEIKFNTLNDLLYAHP